MNLKLIYVTQVATDDEPSRQAIEDAAHAVSAELGTMLQLVQNSSVADVLMVANEGLLNSIGNPEEMKELTTLFIQVSDLLTRTRISLTYTGFYYIRNFLFHIHIC